MQEGNKVWLMGPAFNRMWAGNLISNLSDGVLMAALPLLAISLTDNTVLISAISATVMLPWLLFAIPIGTLVDRVDRRFILAGANAIRGALVGLLAITIATNTVSIYMLIFTGFIIGVCEVAADTTSHSLIPQILSEENLEKGNSRIQISETILQGFIGAPLGSLLYAAAIYIPFFFNGLGFLAASLIALSIPVKYLQDIRTESTELNKKNFISDMKFGISYLFHHKILRRLVLTTSFIGVSYSMATATIVLFMIKELNLSMAFFGIVLTITGLGALLGAVLAPKVSKIFGRSRVMTIGIVVSSLLLFLQGFSPDIYVFVVLATFSGFAISLWNILLMATYQSVIPGEIYGRVHGTRRTLVWGLMPIGSLMGER